MVHAGCQADDGRWHHVALIHSPHSDYKPTWVDEADTHFGFSMEIRNENSFHIGSALEHIITVPHGQDECIKQACNGTLRADVVPGAFVAEATMASHEGWFVLAILIDVGGRWCGCHSILMNPADCSLEVVSFSFPTTRGNGVRLLDEDEEMKRKHALWHAGFERTSFSFPSEGSFNMGSEVSASKKDGRTFSVQQPVSPKSPISPVHSCVDVGSDLNQPARTLEQSNFKKYYHVEVPKHQHEVFTILHNFITALAKAKNIPKGEAERYFKALQNALLSQFEVSEWQEEIPKLAIKLWTSAVKEGMESEFCSLLNETIRMDADEEVFKDAMRMVRLMNTLVASRRKGPSKIWPEDLRSFRGSRLPQEELNKFVEGYRYRASMFLASSFDRQVADGFLERIEGERHGDGLVPVIFIFNLDKDHKCNHVLYLEPISLVKGETEFLYAPYSAFKVLEVKIPDTPTWWKPVEISLGVAIDNQHEPESLPTQSWH